MAQVYRRVLVSALLAVALGLPLPRVCSAQRASPNREHVLPITVESGFWAREKGEVVAGSIPPDALGQTPRDGWTIDTKSLRVANPEGTGDVPFRLSFHDNGRPDRLAFRLTQRLDPLSSARYSLHFRRALGQAEPQDDVSVGGAAASSASTRP